MPLSDSDRRELFYDPAKDRWRERAGCAYTLMMLAWFVCLVLASIIMTTDGGYRTKQWVSPLRWSILAAALGIPLAFGTRPRTLIGRWAMRIFAAVACGFSVALVAEESLRTWLAR
jgi:hypothetical protein